MRVVVTGAGGRLGRAVVSCLQEEGVAVVGVDVKPWSTPGLTTRVVDLRDLGQVYGALAGCDAVLHLGAIPSPTGHPPEVVYANNVLSDFHVFEAAATLGIRRVVQASSVSALGFPYQHRRSEPRYIPIDEDHPLLPQDAYGLSKAAGEMTAAAYGRRGAGSAASLRFPTIVAPADYGPFIAHARADEAGSAPLLWAYIDLRDAARACLLALTASYEGHLPLYITAADTTSDQPTDDLLDRYYPTVARRAPADGTNTRRTARWPLLDGRRAAQVLSFHPAHGWSDMIARDAGGATGV